MEIRNIGGFGEDLLQKWCFDSFSDITVKDEFRDTLKSELHVVNISKTFFEKYAYKFR